MTAEQLIFFVKLPTPGRVKTRLAKAVGSEKAAAIYKSLAEINFKIVSSFAKGNRGLTVASDPPSAAEKIRAWLHLILFDFHHTKA